LTLALEENKTAPMKKDARDLLSAVEKVLNKARSIKKKEREEREWIVEEKERCDKYFKCLSREARELLERKYSMKKIATLCHLESPLSKTKLLTKKALAEIKCKVNRFVDSKLPILSRLSLKNEAVNRFPIWKSRNVVSFTDKRGHTLNGKLYDVKPNYVWVGLDKVKYRDIPKSVKIHIYKNENTERIRQYIEEGKKNRIMARNKLRTRLLKLAIDDSCKKAGYIKFCGSWHTNKQMADILTNKRKLLIEKLFKKKFVELLRAKSFMEDPSSPNGWSSKALLDFKHKIELRNAKINSELQNACNTYDFEKLKRICREYPGTIYEKKARKYVMIKLVKNRATFPKTRKTLQKPQSNTQKGKRGEPPLFHQLLILPRKNFRIHFSD
ncbi:MAG: hypothetical protein KAG97_05620, partial [Victivallales bacterium]|nr:hypothetical protein [Victivallales bacterium]